MYRGEGLLIEWEDFLEYAEESRALGGYFARESDLSIKAICGIYTAEKAFANKEEFFKEIEKLKRMGFKRIKDVVRIPFWLIK